MNIHQSFACLCLYKLTTKINVINKTMTKELIVIHNKVWIGSMHCISMSLLLITNSKCIVISCATCLKSTLKACSLIPAKGDNVMNAQNAFLFFTKFLRILKKTVLEKSSSIMFNFVINVLWCVILVNWTLFVLLNIFLYFSF